MIEPVTIAIYIRRRSLQVLKLVGGTKVIMIAYCRPHVRHLARFVLRKCQLFSDPKHEDQYSRRVVSL